MIPPAGNPLLSRAYLKAVLGENGLRLSRRRGQNFLADGRVLDRILAAAGLEPGQAILEIGPGLGTMTLELRRRGRVLAVESDRGLGRLLSSFCPPGEDFRLEIRDFLKLDLAEVSGFAAGRPINVVSNLPYSAAGAVLERLLGSDLDIQAMTCMLQAEAAVRLVAGPGNKNYGFLSVIGGIYAPPEIVLKVPRGAFFPVPRVDSAVVRFRPRALPRGAPEKKAVFALVAAAFSRRRKMLKNALEGSPGLGYTSETILRGCREAGVDPTVRAEELAPEIFLVLAGALGNPAGTGAKGANES